MAKNIKQKIESFAKSEGHEKQIVEQFLNWLAEEKNAEAKEDALYDIWQQTDSTPSLATLDSLERLKKTASSRAKKSQKLFRTRFVKYAAAILALACITSVTVHFLNAKKKISLTELCSDSGLEVFILPDGTEVTANRNTLIIYSDDYSKKSRNVYLVGEANFKVVKNEKAPFTVNAKEFAVTALGTEFDVAAYLDSSSFKTTLISGKVQVGMRDSDANYILEPADQFLFDKGKNLLSISRVDLEDSTAWQKEILVFRSVRIDEIIPVLERRYSVKVKCNSELPEDKYNFKFFKDSSIEEVLDIISRVDDNIKLEVAPD